MERQLMSTEELAAELGVKPGTLRLWRSSGGGPSYIRVGRGSRSPVAYRRADVEEWVQARRFKSSSDERQAHRAALRDDRAGR